VRCHEDIWDGKFRARTAAGAKWRDHIAHVRVAPSLAGIGRRLRPDYIESFLREPRDVRPGLVPSMPRLALSAEQARDVVAHLVSIAPAASASDGSFEGADLERGRQLLEDKGCGSCHSFSGVAELPSRPDPDAGSEQQRRAVQLAPDLHYARDRLRPENAARWIMDARSIKADTLMPASGLTRDEARDVAAYVLQTPLAPLVPKPAPRRLPLLDRRVGFLEVQERVLGRTCGHCHGNADRALGDGGPGNTGGFGFAPRRLDLTSYAGVASGLLDDGGERHSVFDKLEDGTPRLVAALLARQAEEAGKPNPRVRGMPLGLPSLSPEDIQLVDSWIAQGRPR
jgi:mono/diheme cytochrome c family protein